MKIPRFPVVPSNKRRGFSRHPIVVSASRMKKATSILIDFPAEGTKRKDLIHTEEF